MDDHLQRSANPSGTGQHSRGKNSRSSGKAKRNPLSICLSAVLIIVLVFSVFMLLKGLQSPDRDELHGRWAYDESTVYFFDGKGSGELQLPLNRYKFSYALSDGTLSIDFVDETANDAVYTYTVERYKLILTGGDGTVFEMKKQ